MRCALLAISALIVTTGTAVANAAEKPVDFIPHRAIYDVSLANASGSSGVASVTGRMIYELNGSRCEGFTQNMRFVTRMTSEEGAETLNDLRTSSWEAAAGERLRFSSSQFQNESLADTSQGDAVRKSGKKGVAVSLKKPVDKTVPLPNDVYFPLQHAAALIKAARKGERIFTADLYDGGEKGQKYFLTSAFISPQKEIERLPQSAKSHLENVSSWLVTMAYYDPKKQSEDQTPQYELTFGFYENGVTSHLNINYGEFAITGHMKSIEFLPVTDCD